MHLDTSVDKKKGLTRIDGDTRPDESEAHAAVRRLDPNVQFSAAMIRGVVFVRRIGNRGIRHEDYVQLVRVAAGYRGDLTVFLVVSMEIVYNLTHPGNGEIIRLSGEDSAPVHVIYKAY